MSYFGTYPPARTLSVGPGAQFVSIGAALAAAATVIPAPSASAPVLIKVAPGIYPEAPLAVPAGVVVASSGPNLAAASIVATVPASITATLAPGANIRGFTMIATGVAGVTHIASSVPGAPATAQEIQTVDGDVAFSADGAGVTLVLIQCSALQPAGEGSGGVAGLRASAGAMIRGTQISVVGAAAPDTWTDGLLATGVGSVVSAAPLEASFCGDGLHATDGGSIAVAGGTLSSNTNAIHVGSVGTGGTIRSFALSLSASLALDVLIDGANGTWFSAGTTIDEDRISIAAGATVAALSLAENPLIDEPSISVLGEFHVGSEINPAESAFGGGDSHVRGMVGRTSVVLDAGPFVDITTILQSPAGSTTPVFPTGAGGNAFFMGGNVAFPGIKINTTLAIVLGGTTLVVEISNGAGGWIPIDVCTCDSLSPYLSHAQDIFGRIAFEQIRFGDLTGWAPQVIDGVSKFWLRISLSAAGIGTIPVVQSAKLGTNRSEINADGVVEHFGTGELVKQMQMHQRLTDNLAGAGPVNRTINFSANVDITPIDNGFVNGVLDGIGAIVTVPDGLDTSKPVTLVNRWIPNVATAGDVEWETDLVQVPLGSLLNGTLAEVSQAIVQAVAVGQIDVLREVRFDFDISSLVPGDQFAFSIFRDATAGNPDDTLVGDAEMSSLEMMGTFWR